jgi:hypothetical protein
VPGFAVGRLAGVTEVSVAPGARIVTRKFTVMVAEGDPHVNETVPSSTVPGIAEAKILGSNVTGMGVPKL